MKFWSHNLTSKVASSFLLLSLISVGVVGSVAFIHAREALKQAAFNRLSVAATLKEEEISRWFEDQERDFLLITQFPDVQRNLKILLRAEPGDSEDRQAPNYREAHGIVSTYLANVTHLKPNLQEIFIIDRSSRIILSTDRRREGQYEILANITYLEKVEPGESFAPLFYVSPLTGKPSVTLAASLRDDTGQRQGVLLAHLNLDRIDQIVRERTGLGDSGETYLVGSLITENTFISREDFKTEELTEGISSEGIDSAMQGRSGSGLYHNYANVPVIGVYHWLNDLDLALLVEMGQAEAFAPARQLAVTIMLVGLVSVSVLAIGVQWLTRQLQLSREQLENYSHQLEQKAQEADTANRAKSEFLAHMSHELRTPLNAILGFTQIMSRDTAASDAQLEHLNIIGRSGEHLLTLINDVLEMSKIEAGRMTLNENNFDLYYLLTSLEEMLQIKARSKGLLLIFDRASEVPQYIQTDEGKLRQVLINLLDNAIKFTQIGRVRLWVGVEPPKKVPLHSDPSGEASDPSIGLQPRSPSVTLPATRLWFEVSDTGSGIAPTELNDLFEPFVQAETGRKSQQGTGLGLRISQQFVHLMGGGITVSSTLEQGTTFTFDIRINPAEMTDVPTPRLNRQVIGLAPDQPSHRILVVEDKWENRQLLVKVLTSVGFEVREAENGEVAIAVWQAWEPHLIWMDMRMPIMDGYEATKQIRSHLNGQSTVIIALTASAFEESRSVILEVGCDDFVRKPFQAQVIFDKILEHLGVHYLYAEEPEGRETGNLPETVLSISFSDLAVMPSDWIKQLHDSAIMVDADEIRALIAEIPPTDTPLTDALTHLVDRFCFEEIIELTQPQPMP
ncbi:MAG: response regulator [Cyanobacteria bacterium RU_5_0]|nr:response regulator [Cyanobacteria bacterium RU_5_0]